MINFWSSKTFIPIRSTDWKLVKEITKKIRENYHEEIGEEDPSEVLLIEDELKNKADNRELKKGSGNGVDHFAFEAKLLEVGEDDGDGDNGGGEKRLRHALKEIQKPLKIHANSEKKTEQKKRNREIFVLLLGVENIRYLQKVIASVPPPPGVLPFVINSLSHYIAFYRQ